MSGAFPASLMQGRTLKPWQGDCLCPDVWCCWERGREWQKPPPLLLWCLVSCFSQHFICSSFSLAWGLKICCLAEGLPYFQLSGEMLVHLLQSKPLQAHSLSHRA